MFKLLYGLYIAEKMCSDDPDERLWGWLMFGTIIVLTVVGISVLCLFGPE